MQPPPEVLADHIESICKSSTFARAPRARSLLRYVAACAAKKVVPSEKDIAVEVFERKSFDASAQSIVRVSVLKLRKLLKHYGENEGKDDRLRVEIPKAAYTITAEYTFTGDDTAQFLQQLKRTFGDEVIPQRDFDQPEGMYKALLDERGFLHLPPLFLKWLAPNRKKRYFVTSLDRIVGSIYPMRDWYRHVELFRKHDTTLAVDVYLNSQELGREATIDPQGGIFIHDALRHQLELDFEVVRIASDFRSVVFCKESVYQDRMRLP